MYALQLLIARLVGLRPAHEIRPTQPPATRGYFQGDSSNWVITDAGPKQFTDPTGDSKQ